MKESIFEEGITRIEEDFIKISRTAAREHLATLIEQQWDYTDEDLDDEVLLLEHADYRLEEHGLFLELFSLYCSNFKYGITTDVDGQVIKYSIDPTDLKSTEEIDEQVEHCTRLSKSAYFMSIFYKGLRHECLEQLNLYKHRDNYLNGKEPGELQQDEKQKETLRAAPNTN